MSGQKRQRWQYAGTAGRSSARRKADQAPAATLVVPRPGKDDRRRGTRSGPAAPGAAGASSRSQTRPRGLPRVSEVLTWTVAAVVAGGFLGLLARQTWVLAAVAALLVGVYVWKALRA